MNRQQRRAQEKQGLMMTTASPEEMPEAQQMQLLNKALQAAKAGNKKEAAYHCATICDKVKRGDLALVASKLWVSVDDMNANAWNAVGNMAMSMDDAEQAIKAYGRSLELNPGAYFIFSNLSNAWHKLGDLKKAREYVEKAIESYGEIHPAINQSYIRILSDQGYMDEALEQAKALVDAYPDDSGTNHILGKTWLDHENAGEALPYFRKAAELDKTYPFHQYNVAIALDLLDYPEESLEYFQKAVDLFDKLDPEQTSHTWERRYAVGMLARQNKDKRFKVAKCMPFEDVPKDSKSLVEWRDISEHVSMIRMKDIETPTNEWPLIFDGDNAVMDLFLVTDRNFLVGFRGTGDIILDARFPEQTIEEPCILLPGTTNYYHWVIDYLPRLEAVAACDDLKDLPLVLNADVKDFQRKALEMTGFGDRRIIEIRKRHYLKLKDVYIPHLHGRKYTPSGVPDLAVPVVNQHMVKWVRNAFKDYMKPQDQFPKRVFISRQDATARRCINEDEVYEVAKEYGFEKVKNEGLSYEEQIALYAGVEAVMGVHGAGFTNMVFAPKESSLIEIFPKSTSPKFFEQLCGLLKQKNYRVEGPRIQHNKTSNSAFHDFEIEIDEFRAFMGKWDKGNA